MRKPYDMKQAHQSDRFTLTAAIVRDGTPGMRWGFELSNISSSGCHIADPAGTLREGDSVRLFTAGHGPFVATVVSHTSEGAGLAFAFPLPDHLLHALTQDNWENVETWLRAGAKESAKRRYA